MIRIENLTFAYDEDPVLKEVSLEVRPGKTLGIGGGIGQSRMYSYLLRKAALGECSVTVWPQQLHDVCAKHNIKLLR